MRTVHELAGIYGRQSRNKAKSIDEQLAAGAEAADENHWTIAGTYQDGSSASRFADRQRDDWQRVLDDITDGMFTVLILWEASRGDRTLTSWSQLLDLCRDKGVCIYIISDERLYDPRKARDWKTLASAGVDSAGESDLISARVTRGQAGAAAAGRPSHGRAPYGYVRRYDPNTGELVGQDPDPVKAAHVRQIFDRLAKGETLSAVTRYLRDLNVPTSTGRGRWYSIRVRVIAKNRAYLGERVYRGTTTPGVWPALVEAEQFYDVQRILGAPARGTTRPGRTRHLLSYIATAAPCGWPLCAAVGRYRCARDGCVTIDQAVADRAVEDMIIARLSQPAIYDELRRLGADADEAVGAMRNVVATLQARLDEWRLSAARGETSPATMATIEAELTGQIEAAQRRVVQADIPPELVALLVPGEDVRVRWNMAPMAARRRAVMALAEVKLDRAVVDGVRFIADDRLGRSRWLGESVTWGERWAGTAG